MKSIYIHIPFCKSICTYCDFPKVFSDSQMIDEYLIALKKEIEEYYNDDVLNTIYIGGGTPSCLNMNQLNELAKIISLLKISNDYEFTFECNVDDLNENLLEYLKALQVNRLSIGIQSFNNEKLIYLGRHAEFEDVLDKITLARSFGFNNINVDLMFGLPIEKFTMLKKDLKLFLKLKPDHISCYSLIIENHTILFNNKQTPLDDNLEYKMYCYINNKLKKSKFEHYEVSNYSLANHKSAHNLIYWNNKEYYGFGLGAHGYIEGFRYENTRSLTEYLNGNYRLNKALLSKQDIMENEVMLGLRLIKGINLQDFYNKYGINLQDAFPVKPLLRNKELIYKNGNVYINSKKIYLMNEILLKLI